MTTPLNIVALVIVGVVAVALAATPVACWRERRDSRRERREAARLAAEHARDFAASDRAGYVQRATWGPTRTHPRPPKEDQ